MAFRDVVFTGLTSVFVVDGLDQQTLSRLPAALEAVVRTRPAARRRWPGPVIVERHRSVAAALALVPDHVHRAPAMPVVQLVEAADRVGLHGLPVSVTTTPTACAIVVAHPVFDGAPALDLVHDLLDAASGIHLAPAPAPARLPVLQLVRAARRADVRAFLDYRAARLRSEVEQPARSAAATSAVVVLREDDLKAVRRYREPDRQGRATLLSRVASLLVTALAESAITPGDVPIDVTADMRHLVHGGVAGNFFTTEQVGTLRGDQWAPGALAGRLLAMSGRARGLALATSPAAWVVGGLLGRRSGEEERITLTLAATQRTLPPAAAGATITVTTLHGPATYAFAWQLRDAVHVSVWSTTDRFDLQRFVPAFRELVRARGGS